MFNASVPLNSSFNIQLFIQCSTFYSTFNHLFNVQLFLQHSITHSIFYFLINNQLFIQCSTFILYSTFLSPHFFWSVTKDNLVSRAYSAFEKHHGGDGDWCRRFWCGDWSTKIFKLCSWKSGIYFLTKCGKENCGAAYRCCRSDGQFASHTLQRNFRWSFIRFQRCVLCYAAIFSQCTLYRWLLLQQPRIFVPNLQVLSAVDQHSTSLQNC